MHEIACFPFNATTHYTITDLREEVGGSHIMATSFSYDNGILISTKTLKTANDWNGKLLVTLRPSASIYTIKGQLRLISVTLT